MTTPHVYNGCDKGSSVDRTGEDETAYKNGKCYNSEKPGVVCSSTKECPVFELLGVEVKKIHSDEKAETEFAGVQKGENKTPYLEVSKYRGPFENEKFDGKYANEREQGAGEHSDEEGASDGRNVQKESLEFKIAHAVDVVIRWSRHVC